MLNQKANLDASSTGLKIRAAWALNNLRKDKRALAVYFRLSSASTLRAAQDAIRVAQQAQMKRKGPAKTFLLANKVQSNCRLKPGAPRNSRFSPVSLPFIALKLRQAYADAASLGTVVWRLPVTKKGAEEINELFNQIDQYEKEIAH